MATRMVRRPQMGWGSKSRRSRSVVRELFADTRGAEYVEYIILVAVVALLSIPAFAAAGAEMKQNIRTLGQNAESGLPLMGF
jgi:Flp pilus assembly pilin Flp